MESMLYDAALKGSVHSLLELLQHDPLILDKVVMNCLSETPLHVAVLLGHVDFVKEILQRKPEIADELDSRRSSALHIASQKGYADIVHELLQVNPDMCSTQDADGRNPLHLAAMKGRIDVLGELLKTRQRAAFATTIWGETILHLCVKHNQLEVLKLLLENMDDPKVLNAKDDYGMTILHVAVADKQIEVIKFLTARTTINVNTLNANGFTALDILAQSKRDVKDWEIGESLRRAGAISTAKDNIHLSTHEHGTKQTNSLTSQEINQKQQGKGLQNDHQDDWLEKMRNALLVVASLIATMAFQVATNPPHRSTERETCRYPTASQAAGATANGAFSLDGDIQYKTLLVSNTIGFMASLSIILLLVSGLPLRRRLFMWILMVIIWVAIVSMLEAYLLSVHFAFSAYEYYRFPAFIPIWVFIVIAILFLGHMIRISAKIIRYVRKPMRLRQNQAQEAHGSRIARIV